MPPSEIKEVRCQHCSTLFGIEGDGGELNIKLKDLYRSIYGRVSGPCRKCGSTVVWPDESQVVVTTKTDR